MAPLYSVSPKADGWVVYDVNTGFVLVLDGEEQSGLSFEEAERVADQLNSAAIDKLMSSVANDRDEESAGPRR
jgi:hypothetical protein